ncbi:hypothetical protein [Kitasatospora griseola]|uniref:hypothetical protein n=1 Tax=Kitasatospora griseola TaxID=2064 RepID=UPI0038173D9E
MTPEDLAELLTDQTPACRPARAALLAGGSCEVWPSVLSGAHCAGIVRTRFRVSVRKGVVTLGFPESAEILSGVGEGLVRTGWIRSADRRQYFQVYLDAAATTVLACIRAGIRNNPVPTPGT